MKNKKQLTKAEYQVMDILWSLPGECGFINDILKQYKDPKPAYTTLSTFLKILKDKGFVKSMNVGKMLYFTPTVSRKEYTENYMQEIKTKFFGGSLTSLISFFTEKEKLSEQEIDELVNIIRKGKK